MGFEVRLFGHFEIVQDGIFIPDDVWRTGKNCELLKLLLSAPGQVFSRDELVEALWPGKGFSEAQSNLRGRMSELRHVLEPGLNNHGHSTYIRTTPHGYRFDAEDLWADTEAFQSHYRQGRVLEKDGQLAQAIDLYEQAFQLYRGDFLAEDKHLDWTMFLRSRYARLCLDLLLHLIDGLHQLNRCSDVIIYGERGLELDPYHEGIYRRLIQCYHDVGQTYVALQTYERCVQALGEVALVPSETTERVHQTIRKESENNS